MLSFPDYNEKQIIIIEGKKNKKIQFSNSNFVVRNIETNEIENQVSCYKVFCVFFIGDMTITSFIMRKAQDFGFSLIFMTKNLKPYSVIGAESEGNFLLRQKQYHCRNALEISQHLITNKIKNQLILLKNERNKDEKLKYSIEQLKQQIQNIIEVNKFDELLGIEGYSSKLFFTNYFKKYNWEKRQPRTKSNIINTLLDIGYTHLFNFIECHLRLYGFDVYVGIYHQFFYQRKSLVCDLMEPFRCIIDKKIKNMFGLQQIAEQDFTKKWNQYLLLFPNTFKYTNFFFEAILEYKKDIFIYIQNYYRCFIKEKDIKEYQTFEI